MIQGNLYSLPISREVERELADVEARHPSEHYVPVDDKLRILTAVKKIWRARVTTVFVRQGHHALDPKSSPPIPRPTSPSSPPVICSTWN